jgi:hypothetical protein
MTADTLMTIVERALALIGAWFVGLLVGIVIGIAYRKGRKEAHRDHHLSGRAVCSGDRPRTPVVARISRH